MLNDIAPIVRTTFPKLLLILIVETEMFLTLSK